jgi:hypothetical protein
MLLAVFGIIHIPANVSLAVVLGGLVLGVVASLILPGQSVSVEEK